MCQFVKRFLASICPKHWQLPRATVEWTDPSKTDGGRAQLVDKSFYKWLDSYGWEVARWDVYTGSGLMKWNGNDIDYNINLTPFYLAKSGYYLQTAGIENNGRLTIQWSNTAGYKVHQAGMLGDDTYWLGPARYGNLRWHADSLRCLTQ